MVLEIKQNQTQFLTLPRFFIFFLLCISCVPQTFAQEIPLDKKNCNVNKPPKSSGEDSIHSSPMKIYPRRSEMDKQYTGCQTIWIDENSGYKKAFVYYFDQGRLALSKTMDPENPDNVHICVYKNNKLKSKIEDCTDYELSIREGLGPPMNSMPPNCIHKLRTAFKNKKPGPKGCTYD